MRIEARRDHTRSFTGPAFLLFDNVMLYTPAPPWRSRRPTKPWGCLAGQCSPISPCRPLRTWLPPSRGRVTTTVRGPTGNSVTLPITTAQFLPAGLNNREGAVKTCHKSGAPSFVAGALHSSVAGGDCHHRHPGCHAAAGLAQSKEQARSSANQPAMGLTHTLYANSGRVLCSGRLRLAGSTGRPRSYLSISSPHRNS